MISLGLLLSQTPGMAGKEQGVSCLAADPARSLSTLCPSKPSFGDLLSDHQEAMDYLRRTLAPCSPNSDIMSATYLRLWDAGVSCLPFKVSWTFLGQSLNFSFRLNGRDSLSLNRLMETPVSPDLC